MIISMLMASEWFATISTVGNNIEDVAHTYDASRVTHNQIQEVWHSAVRQSCITIYRTLAANTPTLSKMLSMVAGTCTPEGLLTTTYPPASAIMRACDKPPNIPPRQSTFQNISSCIHFTNLQSSYARVMQTPTEDYAEHEFLIQS